jgi:hypothetical protein
MHKYHDRQRLRGPFGSKQVELQFLVPAFSKNDAALGVDVWGKGFFGLA